MQATKPIEIEGKDIIYVEDVLSTLRAHIVSVQNLVVRKVLPGARRDFTQELGAAYHRVEQLRELMSRSGMGKRLGFVQESGAIQPVIANEVVKQV